MNLNNLKPTIRSGESSSIWSRVGGVPNHATPGVMVPDQGSVQDLGPRLNTWRSLPFLNRGTRGSGFTSDLNFNGRYDAGFDSVLHFDMNGNGRVGRKDLALVNDMMRAVVNDYDFNNDGKVAASEFQTGRAHQARFRGLDSDGNGILSPNEIGRDGGSWWKDSNRDGRVQRSELGQDWRSATPNYPNRSRPDLHLALKGHKDGVSWASNGVGDTLKATHNEVSLGGFRRGADLSSEPGKVGVALNNRGHYVAAGEDGFVANGQYGRADLGDDKSPISASMNSSGKWVAAGEDGVLVNGQFQKVDLGDNGTATATAINERGQWIAAGEDGIVVNGVKYKMDLGDNASNIAVDINEKGQWIAAGEDEVVVNGQRRNIDLGSTRSQISASIDENGNWQAMGDSKTYKTVCPDR